MRRLAPLLIGLTVVVTTFFIVTVFFNDPVTPPPVPPVEATTCGTGANQFSVSHASGFHRTPFPLTVSTGDGQNVFYTLDGTRPELRPTSSSRQYSQPIVVQDLSLEPGPLSAIRTSVYAFPGTLDIDGGIWQLARPNMDRGVPVRFRSDAGVECTFVYFVGPQLVRDLPVIHLTLNPDFLFDHDTGIYVLGATFDEWREGNYDPGMAFRTEGNYSQRGRDWERPFVNDLADSIVMHYFVDGDQAYSTNLGIRIHGGTSRTFPQKSLRLYARTEYGNESFDYPFFGEGGPQTHRRLILRQAGTHCMCIPDYGGISQPHLTDGYLQGLVGHLSIDIQSMTPAVLFINGEYWGIHHIRDRQDEEYVAIVYGLDATEVDVVEAVPPPREFAEPAWFPLFDLLDFMAVHSATEEAAYAHFQATMDIDNYIDWLTVQLFVANYDLPANYRLWRARVEPEGGELGPGDGRWRWFLNDLDQYDHNRKGENAHDMFAQMSDPESVTIPEQIFRWLSPNDDFRRRLANRIADELNTTYLPDRTVPVLDDLADRLGAEMIEQIDRWARNIGHDLDEWKESVDHLRNFMLERPGHVWEHARRHFGLPDTTTVRLLSGEGGAVRVNGVLLHNETPGVSDPSEWWGSYFVGLPITLTAVPQTGFEFAGWDGVPEHLAGEISILIDPADAARVTARFSRPG